MRVWADIYDAAGNRLGPGPVTTGVSAMITRALDGAGSVQIEAPLTDARARELLQNERRMRLFVEQGDVVRELGRGIIREVRLSVAASGMRLVADGPDIMDELKRVNTLLARLYSDAPVDEIVDALVALAPGWAAVTDDALPNVSARYDGVSALKALQVLAEQQGLHLRLAESGNAIEFGAFGSASGLRLLNAVRVTPALAANAGVALIESISLVQSSEAVANWLIPIGGGEGQAALTLEKATRVGAYSVESMTGPDGATLFYLRDTSSISTYGQIEKVGTFKNITPLSNTDGDITNAANALYDAASAWLQRASVRQDTYSVTVRNLRQTVRPGDKIQLIYTGVVERDGAPHRFLDVNAEMWVLKVTERIGLNGVSATLEVSTVDRYAMDSARVVIGALEAIELRNVFVQPYPTMRSFFRDKEIASGSPVVVPIKVTDATLYLNRCLLTLTTRPLRATATGAASGGGATSGSGGGSTPTTSSGGSQLNLATSIEVPSGSFHYHNFATPNHTHSVTIPNHTHSVPAHTHSLSYGIFDDSQHPQTISVYINGVNRTSALGGTWAASNAPIAVELDITEYLVNASGGLRQEHEIEIRCASGRGIVEAQVELYEVVQAIRV